MATTNDANKARRQTGARGAGQREVMQRPGQDNSPGHGGYLHADTRMGHALSEQLGQAERIVTGKKKAPARADTDTLDKS